MEDNSITGSVIQRNVLRKALESPTFSKEVLPQAPLSIYEGNNIYKELSNIIVTYYQTNRDTLTEESLLTLTESKLDRMKVGINEQRPYFQAISELYGIRDSGDDSVIDEKIEDYIKKHMRMELIMKATKNLDNEKVMEDMEKELREISLIDVSGKKQEIINVIDDTETKKQALQTIHKNTISTGFSSVDKLNGGGLAKGELGIIVAGSGTGKCTTGDTLIYTDKGLIEIQDIPNHYHVDEGTNESKAKIISYDTKGNRYIKDTSHWYNLGEQDTIKITTKAGYTIEGTPEHPIMVMNQEGNLEFKELQSMEQGDYITLSKGDNLWSKEDKVTPEEAYLLGLLVGDGSLSIKGRFSLSQSNKKIYEHFIEGVKKEWGVKKVHFKKDKRCNGINHHVYDSKLNRYLASKGLHEVTAKYKEIPHSVLGSSKETITRFLQGLYDTDGYTEKGSVSLLTASHKLAKQMQVVLLNYGIRTSIREKKVKNYEHNNYYVISIYGANIDIFNKEIGFRLDDKNKQKLEDILEASKGKVRNTNVDLIPNQSSRVKRIRNRLFRGSSVWNGRKQMLDGRRLSGVMQEAYSPSRDAINYILKYANDLRDYSTEDVDLEVLNNITKDLMFDSVATIEESKEVVYDFTVPETHSFVANGIVNHNTLLLTNLATNYTKLKYNVLYIALEELENRMLLRFEQSMLRQNRSDILTGGSLNEDKFNQLQDFYKTHREHFGNLLFARYSPNTVTPAKIEQLISDVMLREGVKIDVVIIDYPDLLRIPNATGNEAEDGGRLFEEIRRIGQDYNVVMWTASQMNRTAYSAIIRTSEHMEGAHRKKNAAELVLAVNQTPEEFQEGFIRLYADKVRNPPDGAYDKMVGLRVLGSSMTVRDYINDEEAIHDRILEEANTMGEETFKRGRKANNPKPKAPNYANEINNSITGGRS